MTTAADQAVAAALGISVRHLRELVRAGERGHWSQGRPQSHNVE